MNSYETLCELLKTYSLKEIAEGIEVNLGTAKRWVENQKVPWQYEVEFRRFAGWEIDYTEMSEVEKDQFFTSPSTAEKCFSLLKEKLSEWGENEEDFQYIEPSVGDGSFGRLLKEGSIFIDVEPRYPGAIRGDFLKWAPEEGKYIVIGNPPFGFRGNLALKFINHAAGFAKYVAFIVPQTFESNGKGSCKSRVRGMNLVHSEPVDSSFYYPDGRKTTVSCVFQIWSSEWGVEEEEINLDHLCKVMTVSDGGTPGTTRNKKYHSLCSYFVPGSDYGSLKMVRTFTELSRPGYGILIHDDRIRDVIEGIDYDEIAFRSTNGAMNLRTDIIERAIYDACPAELKQARQPLMDLLL